MVAQRNITPFPPPSDAPGDDFAAMIRDMIRAELLPYMNRLGTITSISGENAQVSVQEWDDDAGGEQFRARMAGTNFQPGDTVLLAPVSAGEYVVAGKVANSAADRPVVGTQEIETGAIRGHHIPNGGIPLAKLAESVPTGSEVQTIAGNQANQVFTQRIGPYATTNALADAISNLNAAISARVTQAQMNAALAGKANTAHTHWASDLFTSSGDSVQGSLVALKLLSICGYDNRNQSGNPCKQHRAAVSAIA